MRTFVREHLSILNTARIVVGHWLLGKPGEQCSCEHCKGRAEALAYARSVREEYAQPRGCVEVLAAEARGYLICDSELMDLG